MIVRLHTTASWLGTGRSPARGDPWAYSAQGRRSRVVSSSERYVSSESERLASIGNGQRDARDTPT